MVNENNEIIDVPIAQPLPKNVNKWLIIGLSLVVIFVLGVLLYFTSQVFTGKKTIPPKQNQEIESSFLPATLSPVEWESYVDDKQLGFTFKYPAIFSLITSPFSTTSGEMTVVARLTHKENPLENSEIIISTVQTDLTIEEFIKSQNYCPESFQSCTPAVEGLMPGSVQFESINRQYGSIDTIIKNKSNIYDFSLGMKMPGQSISQDERQLYAQLISSFKFTENQGLGLKGSYSYQVLFQKVIDALKMNNPGEIYQFLSPSIKKMFTYESFVEGQKSGESERGKIQNIEVVSEPAIKIGSEWETDKWAEAKISIISEKATELYIVRFLKEEGQWWVFGTIKV